MDLICIFKCDCNPGKIYKTSSTFKNHTKSLRHTKWEAEQVVRDVHVRLGEQAAEILRLKQQIASLQTQLQQLKENPPRRVKRRVSEAQKRIVASRQDWKCAMCDISLPSCFEVDHSIPLFCGGNNELSNLKALCRNCHGNKTQKEFMVDVDE